MQRGCAVCEVEIEVTDGEIVGVTAGSVGKGIGMVAVVERGGVLIKIVVAVEVANDTIEVA